MKRRENRAAFLQCFHVLRVIVGRAGFPATEEDANPFEGKRANNGVIFFAPACMVVNIVAGPLAVGQRLAGKLVKGLSQEF